MGVEEELTARFGAPSGRASVTFVGADPVDVLRFGPAPDGLVRYAALGPACLLLTLRGARDGALRALAVLATSPVVDEAVVAAGASLDLGEPLWPGARFTAVLVGEPDGSAFPVVPMTRNEAAFKRVHGAAALEERLLADGADPYDPERAEADLR